MALTDRPPESAPVERFSTEPITPASDATVRLLDSRAQDYHERSVPMLVDPSIVLAVCARLNEAEWGLSAKDLMLEISDAISDNCMELLDLETVCIANGEWQPGWLKLLDIIDSAIRQHVEAGS